MSKARIAGAAVAAALAIATPFIAGWEGKRNAAYLDAAGVWTICYGHTGPEVKMGLRYSDDQCTAILREDIAKHVAPVLKCSPILKDHPNQLAGSASFAFNFGGPAYCGSKIARHFNAGDFKRACDAFLGWDNVRTGAYLPGYRCFKAKSNGQIYCKFPGLTRRREAERRLCLKGLS